MQLKANGLQIEVEDSGGEGRPVVLLIMGLGMQLIAWPAAFVQALIDAGFRVVRHDNRDIGLSHGFEALGAPNLLWQGVRQQMGLSVRSMYSLQDMADDALGVLDALGIRRAHVVGASMGGMIAQRLAASAPGRVQSLVSIMSSSGARGLPGPRPEVAAAMTRRPAGTAEEVLVAHGTAIARLISSPAYPQWDEVIADRILRSLRRAYRPTGIVRQTLAIAADDDRPAVLPHIHSPTLVMHGDADPLVPMACGQDSARRIAGARFVPVSGMGHDMPPQVVKILLQDMIPFLQNTENSA